MRDLFELATFLKQFSH